MTKAVDEIGKHLSRLDVLLIGPGLGRNTLVSNIVPSVVQQAKKLDLPMVFDADGLAAVVTNIELVMNQRNVVLTPNFREFDRLLNAVNTSNQAIDNMSDLQKAEYLAQKLGNVTIVKKGAIDIITNGQSSPEEAVIFQVDIAGSLRRVGGQGDVLSGSIAAFIAFHQCHRRGDFGDSDTTQIKPSSLEKLDPFKVAALAGCIYTRMACKYAFETCKRSMATSNVIEQLNRTNSDFEELIHRCRINAL